MQRFFTWLKGRFKSSRKYLVLKQFSLFADLSDFELYLLYELTHTRCFEAGELIYEEGYPLEVIYFVHSGDIKLKGLYGSTTDKQVGPGEYLGILDMYHGKKRSSTAIAQSDASLHAISRTDMISFIESRPRAGVKILSAIASDFCRFVFEVAKDNEHKLD